MGTSADGILFCDACGGTLAAGGGSLLGGRLLCTDCLRQLEGRRVRWRPSPRLLGLVISALVVFGLAAYLWHRHDVAHRQEEARRLFIQREHFAAIATMERLLRFRGDLSREAGRTARRDQLLLMCVGLDEDEARCVLETFAEFFPGTSVMDWVWASYAWLGRRPQPGRPEADRNLGYFVRRFQRKPASEREVAAEEAFTFVMASPSLSREWEWGVQIWLEEASLGLVACPSDQEQSWWWQGWGPVLVLEPKEPATPDTP